MQIRPYGRTGIDVPVLGFGAMQVGDPSIDDARAEHLLHHVLDEGMTLIDTARSYGIAEERIGRYLQRRRDEFVLSTKVGYGTPGIPDWTYDCVMAGVDAARDRLRTDVIDIVHLHSCPLETLQRGDVVRALVRCRELGKLRVAAYSGDSDALRYAVNLTSGFFTSPASTGEVARAGDPVFQGVQASISVCDQQGVPVLRTAQARGLGTIAKRSLCGRPWAGNGPTGDFAHDEYRRRFGHVRAAMADVDDWDAFALRFTAFAPGVDCVIVGGTDAANVDRNIAAVRLGPLKQGEVAAVAEVYEAHGQHWEGLV